MTITADTIETLASHIDALGSRDREFASSLIAAYRKYHRLSDRQAPWVTTLLERATTPAPTKPKLPGLHAAFACARDHLKAPVLRAIGDGFAFKISPAKATSKNVGALYIKSDGEYVGKVLEDGALDLLYRFRDRHDAIAKSLGDISADPIAAARNYGRATGECCFCGRHLEDEKSTERGYGPVCAKKWGLA